MNGVKSKDKAARDLELAVKEASQWIQEVTGRQLDENVRAALEDGTVLCELIQCIQPGSIKKINRRQTAIAHLDNLRQFLTACEQVGLKDSQLFDLTDLQEPGTLRMRSGGVKHTTADRRIRNVCITLYWLGRAVRDLPDYTGPYLNLESFREILDIPHSSQNFLKGYEQHVEMPLTSRSSQRQRQAFFLQGLDTGVEEKEEEHVPPPPLSASSRSSKQRQAFFLQGLDTGIEDEIEEKKHIEEKPVPESPSTTSAQRQAFYLQGVVDTAPAEPTPPPAPKPIVAPKPKPVASKSKPFSKPNAGRTGRHMAMRNGGNDVTPDELLDKIQSTVDEMLSEFHPVTPSPTPSPIPQPEVTHHDALPEGHTPSPSPPPPHRLEDVKEEDEEAVEVLNQPDAQSHDLVDAVTVNGYPEDQYPGRNQYTEETDPQSFEPMFVTVHMTTQNGSYGLQLIGGIDTALPAQVERVVPGRPAESSGVVPGDYIVTVNQVDVTSLTHFELISLIKQCGTEGDMALGIVRPSNEGSAVTYSDEEVTSPSPMFSRNESQLLWEEEHRERERQRKEVAMMYVDDNKCLEEENEKEERVMHHVNSMVMAERQMVLESNKTTIPPEHNYYQEEEHIATVNSFSSPPPPLDSGGESDGDIFAPVPSPTVDISLLSDFLVPQTSTHKEKDKIHQEREADKSHKEREVNKSHQEREVDKSHRVPATPLATHEPPSSNVSTPMDTVRTISEEPEMNGIKVRPVQRTRWTPDSRDTTVRHESSFSSNPASDPRPQYYKPIHRSTPTSGPPATHPVKNLAAAPATVVTKNVKRSSQGAPNCSHCLTAITRGPMMSIPERHLHFHSRCLTCIVCHSPLSMGYGHTTVFLRQSLPHCASCYSTDSGLKVTTC